MNVELIPDVKAEKVAYIFGSGCAMAQAIADRDERRGRGEDAHIFLTVPARVILVGPIPKTKEPKG